MSLQIPTGYQFAATEAAVKKPGRLDFALLLSNRPASVAGAFTRNRVQAAPVAICRRRLSGRTARAVLVNSGNANACSGEPGLEGALHLTRALGGILDVPESQVFPCSTGVIGLPLPVARMEAALPELVRVLSGDPEPFARAIMTTDSFPKMVGQTLAIGEREVRVLGIAKGAGMIRPDMATMLAFLATDAHVGAEVLQSMLSRAVDLSFNRITVDGDTSTNDTVLVLANGAAGGPCLDGDSSALHSLASAIETVCRDLARMIVRDGEGATKLVDVVVREARSDRSALTVARTVAESPLVKTALHGEDPNWGRIAAAIGRSGAYDGGPYQIAIGGVPVVRDGLGLGPDAEAAARERMKMREFEIEIRLAEGHGTATVATCDLTADYVRINAEYRS